MIFSILFRVSNHQIVGKRIKLHLLFKLSYLSSNFALTLGYINPASNNPAQNCNSLLCGVPAVHLSKLQRLQNAAARLVSYTPKHSHMTPLLFRLHWLPIRLTVRECSPYNLRSQSIKWQDCLSGPFYQDKENTHWETKRFQLLRRKYGTTFHYRSGMTGRNLIHLRSCSRTIILKQLITFLPERPFWPF